MPATLEPDGHSACLRIFENLFTCMLSNKLNSRGDVVY